MNLRCNLVRIWYFLRDCHMRVGGFVIVIGERELYYVTAESSQWVSLSLTLPRLAAWNQRVFISAVMNCRFIQILVIILGSLVMPLYKINCGPLVKHGSLLSFCCNYFIALFYVDFQGRFLVVAVALWPAIIISI